MKRLLINANHTEELRVALTEDGTLLDLDIENQAKKQIKSNIYKAKITRIEPSLEAAFVDYGGERHGFLPLKDMLSEDLEYDEAHEVASNSEPSEDASKTDTVSDSDTDAGKDAAEGEPSAAPARQRTAAERRKAQLEQFHEGQEVLVQISKEERGNKGAVLTSYVSLAGRFMVLMPRKPGTRGVSKRIDGEDRAQIRAHLKQLDVPADVGVIVRTAGIDRSLEELRWDLDYLLRLWHAVDDASARRPAPFLVFQDSDVIVRTLRDHLTPDIEEVITDSRQAHESARAFMSQVMPQYLEKLKLYSDAVPLFVRHRIEGQIEQAFKREVRLPSGGSIVIDKTEALVAIDVNSSRSTKGGDIEETALNTNLEAAREVARQLRLRDLGGLVVIDFIDMSRSKAQRQVENTLRDALKSDRSRIQLGKRLSRFGLMEMSRQRIRPALDDQNSVVCPRCQGQGTVRQIESLSIAILRQLEEEAMKDQVGRLVVQVPVDVSTFMLNEKRAAVSQIEQVHEVQLVVLPDVGLEVPHYRMHRFRQHVQKDVDVPSYSQRQTTKTPQHHSLRNQPVKKNMEPAVKTVAAEAPPVSKKDEGGFVRRLLGGLFGGHATAQPALPAPTVIETASVPTERKKPQRQRKQRDTDEGRKTGNRRQSPQQQTPKAAGRSRSKDAEAGNAKPVEETTASVVKNGAVENTDKPDKPRRRRRRRRSSSSSSSADAAAQSSATPSPTVNEAKNGAKKKTQAEEPAGKTAKVSAPVKQTVANE